MPALVPLHSLAVGQSAVVKRLTCAGVMRRRLMDLGLINGTRIESVQRSPSGAMAAYQIRGAVLAIRDQDAKDILIAADHNEAVCPTME